jgi:poly-gamma-glutamate capsule biosynthesis protein CapA/YwtB (metallophosphatase superfamily)
MLDRVYHPLSTQTGLIPFLFVALLVISLSACTPASSSTVHATTVEIAQEGLPPTSPPVSTAPPSTIQPTNLPPAFVLKVPTKWAQIAAATIGEINANPEQPAWQLDVGQPSITDLDVGWADAVLVEGNQGILVGQRPIALAVPFTSHWDDLTLQEAQDVLDTGSEFIQVMDWADMQPGLKSIPVEGYHPSDPEYPLQRSWSLLATDQAKPALQALIPALQSHIERDPHIELAAVGDLMLARNIGDVLEAGDLAYPFENVVDKLESADLTIGNLESALGSGGVPEEKGYTFRAPPQAAPALAMAGFDLLSLANNHAMDYGPGMLLDAINALQVQGIATIGAGQDEEAAHRPFFVDFNGLQITFLSFVDVPQEFRGFDTRSWQASEVNPGLAWADPQRMRLGIEQAKEKADIVVVLLHSGYEYVPQPSPPQIAAARIAVEAGADLVIGHHAHILQPVEFQPQGVIVYGLGNFVFEDAGPPESVILKVWLDEDGVREIQFVPILLDDTGRPVPVSGREAVNILESLYSYTDAWKAQTPVLNP